jgi:hypothetical protein
MLACAAPDQAGEAEGDELFYTDKRGGRDHECLSLGCDHAPVLDGRTPLQTYADFIAEFAAQCQAADLWGALRTAASTCFAGPCARGSGSPAGHHTCSASVEVCSSVAWLLHTGAGCMFEGSCERKHEMKEWVMC